MLLLFLYFSLLLCPLPLHQKIGVIRTLMNRCEKIPTEEEDKEEEKLMATQIWEVKCQI